MLHTLALCLTEEKHLRFTKELYPSLPSLIQTSKDIQSPVSAETLKKIQVQTILNNTSRKNIINSCAGLFADRKCLNFIILDFRG